MLLIILFLTTILPGNIYGLEVGSGLGSGDEVHDDLCELPDGVFPDPDSCTVFIKCRNGEPEFDLCSDGLYFNPLKVTCDFSKTGNCSDFNDFETSARVETNDVACPEVGSNVYPIQNSCTEYYMCQNRTAFKVECPMGLLLNAKKLTCDYSENVECSIISNNEESAVGIKTIYENDEEESDMEAATFFNIDKSSTQSAETTIKINAQTGFDRKDTKEGDLSSNLNLKIHEALSKLLSTKGYFDGSRSASRVTDIVSKLSTAEHFVGSGSSSDDTENDSKLSTAEDFDFSESTSGDADISSKTGLHNKIQSETSPKFSGFDILISTSEQPYSSDFNLVTSVHDSEELKTQSSVTVADLGGKSVSTLGVTDFEYIGSTENENTLNPSIETLTNTHSNDLTRTVSNETPENASKTTLTTNLLPSNTEDASLTTVTLLPGNTHDIETTSALIEIENFTQSRTAFKSSKITKNFKYISNDLVSLYLDTTEDSNEIYKTSTVFDDKQFELSTQDITTDFSQNTTVQANDATIEDILKAIIDENELINNTYSSPTRDWIVSSEISENALTPTLISFRSVKTEFNTSASERDFKTTFFKTELETASPTSTQSLYLTDSENAIYSTFPDIEMGNKYETSEYNDSTINFISNIANRSTAESNNFTNVHEETSTSKVSGTSEDESIVTVSSKLQITGDTFDPFWSEIENVSAVDNLASIVHTETDNIQTISTTEIPIVFINDTTETTESNTDYSNVFIRSRHFREYDDYDADYQFIPYSPAALRTETTRLSSSTVTESEHREILTDGPLDAAITLNPVCVTSEGNFSYPDDCNKFYLCTKGVPVLSSCVEDEHFDPLKRICTNPCLAMCDPNADCSTTESLNSAEETASQTSLSRKRFSSDVLFSEFNLMPYIPTTLYFTEETTLDKISGSTFENTQMTNEDAVSHSTLKTTAGKDRTDSLTALGSSSKVLDIVSKNSTETVSDEYVNTTYIEEPTVAFDSNSSSDVPITSTITYEIANQTQTDATTFLTEEMSTKTASTSFSASSEIKLDTESTSYLGSDGKDAPITSTITYEITNQTHTDATTFLTEGMSTKTASTSPSASSEIKLDTDSTSDLISVGKDETSNVSTNCKDENCFSKFPDSITRMQLKLCCQNGFLSLPNCNEYLDCSSEVRFILECPMGLHFNPTTRVCDWPYKAECGTLPKPIFEPTNVFSCPCKNCLIPSTTSCSEYFLCLDFAAYKMNCSYNLYFDRYKNTCNYALLVDCNDLASNNTTDIETTESSKITSTTELSISTTKTLASFFICPSREGHFKYTGNCGMYYQCSNWYPYPMHCPAQTHFSERTKNCEYPCDANCDLTLNCGSPLTVSLTDPQCSCLNCKIPSSESCTKYIVCFNGKARIEDCPWGQAFDVNRFTCDWDHKVACHHSSICPKNNGIFSYKDDCRKFLECSNGIPYIMNCPDTLEFDPVEKRCEWPSGRCNSYPTIDPAVEDGDYDLQRTSKCPKPGGLFPAEECSQFLHCSNGIAFLKDCPDGLHFNPQILVCDWPEIAKCDMPVMGKELNVVKTQDKEGWKCPKTFGYFSDDKHCNKFYHCSFGMPALKECPPGLLYNARYQTCDWEKNVRCNFNRHQKARRCLKSYHHAICLDDRKPQPHVLCNMYFDCTTERACAKKCPFGLYFNNLTRLCDFSENVKCFNNRKGMNPNTRMKIVE